MESLKENYDRVILGVCAVIAIALGSLLTLKALALPDQYTQSFQTEGKDPNDTGVEIVRAASAHLEDAGAWESPSLEGVPMKKLPLFKSVPIWVRGTPVDPSDPQNSDFRWKEYDLLDPSVEPMHEGLGNRYIYDHQLNAGRSDVADMDPDGDGFSNGEEFADGKTDPNDPNDFPPLTNKLSLAKVEATNYVLEYRIADPREHSIRETLTDFAGEDVDRKTEWYPMGATFGSFEGYENRFTLQAHQEVGGNDVLTLLDTATNQPFQIARREPYPFPTYYAVFHYAHPAHEGILEGVFKVGDRFSLPNEPGVEYEVTELTGDVATGAKILRHAPGGTPTPIDVRGDASLAPDPAAAAPAAPEDTGLTPETVPVEGVPPVVDPAAPEGNPAPDTIPAEGETP